MTRPSSLPVLRASAAVLAAAMAALTLTVATPAAPSASAAAPAVPGASTPVPVGAGSYAAAPPKSLDRPGHDVTGVVDKELYIDPSMSGEPVPTNEWWSDLLVSRYSGNLWADPFVVSNTERGTRIAYPTEWNDQGTSMLDDSAIQVQGSVPPQPDPSDIDMAGFEDATLPAGWTSTGDAFAAPTTGTAPGQTAVEGYLGKGLVNSFTSEKGDGAMGTLTSPEFTVDRDFIGLLVGGGAHPGRTEARLVIDGVTVASATGEQSEILRWVTWDVTAHAGQRATIQIVDDMPAGWAHVLVDQIVRTDAPEGIGDRFGTAFRATQADALRWGDWNVSWRMHQSASRFMDVTLARGTPYAWFEFAGVVPRISVGAGATFAAADGTPLRFPATVDAFTITQDDRSFGVHAPPGSSFDLAGDTIEATLAADYLVVSALPATGADLDDMSAHAFAIPRDTTMEHEYSAERAEVVETYAIETEALQGTDLDTIQGWLPHTYNSTTTDIDFAPSTYATPRGLMRTAIGHGGWQVTYPFTGITPVAPAPQETGRAHDYDVAVMQDFVRSYAERTGYGGDTYWGGKDVLQLAEYMTMAKQIGDTASYEELKASLTTALSDWFTYAPGEEERFFARYDTWKALVGFGDSYGSLEFTDNHFHYGYFTLAAGLLAFEDPEWAAEYGPMATLVAKQYANWDRDDEDFPYLRTFDVFEGHSYAGGYSSSTGNNQESSSEAIQSWAGLFLLGSALGDTGMQATGAMGYVTERAAVMDYYLDYNGNPDAANGTGVGVFPDAYAHSTTGILGDSGQAFATYFSGDPAWIYGIQWLPTGPWLNYLGWDRGFSKSLLDDMFDERPASIARGAEDEIEGLLGLAAKQASGTGTWYGGVVTKSPVDSVNTLKDVVRKAHLNNPDHTSAEVAANPLFDAATGELRFTVGDDGQLAFPDEHWTPGSLPDGFAPATPPADRPDADPDEWAPGWALFDYLSTGYTADPDVQRALHSYDVSGYESGVDTAQAAGVYSRMGDALGNVVLGLTAQSDPDFYADMHAELSKTGDPVVTSDSMAGAVYYNAMANRSLGSEVLTRHVANPTSQVYRDAETGRYSYAVYNGTDAQAGYDVYDGDTVIGTIQVPARTMVQHHLDAALDRIVVTAPGSAKTVQRGDSLRFTAVGYDQYGATIPLDDLRWSVDGGGSVDADGTFTATEDADPVTVTATSGSTTAAYELRVAPRPVLSALAVSPAFVRVTEGGTTSFSATGLDQYGDPIEAGPVSWETTADGSVDAAGVLSARATGAGYVRASADGASGTSVVAVIAPGTDIARGKPVAASTSDGANTAEAAVDGSSSTRWESAHGAGEQWLRVDLGAQHDISSVHVGWETAAAAEYEIQVADDADGPWTTVRTVSKSAATADDVAVEATGRYVRILGLERLTGYGYSIWDLGVTGTPAASAIETSELLVTPQDAVVVSGRDVRFAAWAFDAEGNGGRTAASFSAEGGAMAADGTYTAGATAGAYPVTVESDGVRGSATVTVRANGDGGSGQPEVPAPGALADVAYGKGVTASSTENAGTPAVFAVDASPTSRWSSAAVDDAWIEVDLGSVASIARIDLDWEAAYGSGYLLQTRAAAGDAWETVVTESAGDGGHDGHAVDTRARFVRMTGLERATPYGYSLFGLSVWSPDGTVVARNLAEGAEASATSEAAPGTKAENAVDGDPSSRWASEASDDQSITVDLGREAEVRSVAVEWEAAYASEYLIQGATSAAGPFTTLATERAGSGGTEAFDVRGAYRFIRVQGVERATPYGYSIFEIEVR
ncbi:F5/8 type C domain protein [Clavibacter michiganensis]|uniref:glucan endo-1,3-beta-D-glucosidase n=1 Tax=Clavibacter michiganensis TaxID=28447 RepID=A0A251YBB5_9MICO|nr:discoidin domain-containing protein [Clavibacter michiganensis]OUE21545.1 F5/8 type C domain protein [Clavibacter michiganensis]